MKFFSRLKERLNSGFSKLSSRQALFLAVLGGLIVAMSIYLYMSSATISSKQDRTAATVDIVVASKDINPHTTLTSDDLKLVSLPKTAVPTNALTKVDDAIGKITQFKILADDAITPQKLFQNTAAASFVGSIPANCRAIAIPITNITGVADFIKPGDRVDVMVINKSQNKVDGKLLLQDILVLAVNNTDLMKQEKDKKQTDSTTAAVSATLAVNANDVLRLATAAQNGLIYLALRPTQPRDPFLLLTDYSSGQTPAAPTPMPENTAIPAPTSQAPAAASSFSAPPAAVAPATTTSKDGITVIKGTSESVVSL